MPYTKGYIDFAAKPDWYVTPHDTQHTPTNHTGCLRSTPQARCPSPRTSTQARGLLTAESLRSTSRPSTQSTHWGKQPTCTWARETMASPSHDPACRASKLFPAFVAFFKAAGADEAEKEATLLAELQGLADALKASGGPFIGGASPNATDMSVAPKVHHMMLALEGIKVRVHLFRTWCQSPTRFTHGASGVAASGRAEHCGDVC